LRNATKIYAIAICLIILMLGLPSVLTEVHAVSCFSGNNVIPTGYGTAPSSGGVGQSLTLTAHITGCRSQGTSQGAFIVSWTFGDGTTGSTRANGDSSVTHTYSSAGNFGWSISLSTDPNAIGPPDAPGTDSPQSGTISVGGTFTQHIEPSLSVFATNYIFQGTGQSYIYFNAYVAPSVSAATITVQFTDNGDQYTRVFDVLVNGNEITPNTGCASNSQGMCIGPGQQPWTSNDITSIVTTKNYVQVGIKITTFVGSWTVWAFLSMSARYESWTDQSPSWGTTDHPIVQAHMNLYDFATNINNRGNRFLSAPSIEVQATEFKQEPVVYIGVTAHIPDWVQNDYKNSAGNGYVGMYITNDIHISITDSSGATLPDSSYTVVTGYGSPNSSGGDFSSTGSDILNIIAAVASALPGGQYAAVPASIAAVLLHYQQKTFSFGTDTSGPGGAFLSDHQQTVNDLSDLLSLTLHFSGPGTFTFHLQTTTSVHFAEYICAFFGCSYYDTTLSNQSVYYTSTYTY